MIRLDFHQGVIVTNYTEQTAALHINPYRFISSYHDFRKMIIKTQSTQKSSSIPTIIKHTNSQLTDSENVYSSYLSCYHVVLAAEKTDYQHTIDTEVVIHSNNNQTYKITINRIQNRNI